MSELKGYGGVRDRRETGVILAAAILCASGVLAGQAPASGPRGKPIRPAGASLTNATPADLGAARIVTLPGGVVITNLPPEVLPRTTNIVLLPSRAARKFEPLGYLATSFTVLARFFLKPPQTGSGPELTPAQRWDAVRRQIPDDVLGMDGKKVAVAGFILPISLAEGRATEFLLLRTQGACCFGLVPRVNELIIVRTAAPGIEPSPDTPFVVGGTLSVKWVGEGDQLTAIYEMRADRVERAADLRGGSVR